MNSRRIDLLKKLRPLEHGSRALLAYMLLAAAARADEHPQPLVLTAYADLNAGQYSAALIELGAPAPASLQPDVASSTNLCVAYVASGNLPAAHTACDAAISAAQAKHAIRNEELAVAYANRAVLQRLSYHPAAAVCDLAQAAALAPQAPAVRRNLEALNTTSTAIEQTAKMLQK